MDALKNFSGYELMVELQSRGYAVSVTTTWCDDDVDANNKYLQVDLSGINKTEILIDVLDSEKIIELVNQRIYDALLDIQKNG